MTPCERCEEAPGLRVDDPWGSVMAWLCDDCHVAICEAQDEARYSGECEPYARVLERTMEEARRLK